MATKSVTSPEMDQLLPSEQPHPKPLFSRIMAQGLYETRIAIANGEQLLVSIILPLMVLFALAFTGLLDADGTSSIQIATPGVFALSVLSAGLTGQGIATGFDRRYGVLTYLSTTPLGPAGLLLGKVAAVIMVQITQIIVIGTVALMLGWRPEIAGLLPTLIFLLTGALTFTALGLLIAGTVRPEGTLALTNLLWVLLGAAGGVVFPLAHFTGSQVIAFLPSAALGDGLRSALLDGEWNLLAWGILLAWGVIFAAGTVRFFKWR